MTISQTFLVPFLSGVAFTAIGGLLVLAGCAVSPSSGSNDEPIEEFNRVQGDLAKGGSVASPEEKIGLQKWKELLADLSVENMKGNASQVYAEKIFFNDTLKTIRTGEELEAYLIETAEMLNSGSVEYRDTVRSEDGSYYVRWEMVYRGKKLAGGKPIRTIGMSQLRFDEEGRVVFHQDFWDSARGIFEHIPVVGSQVRFIKRRL